MILKRYSQTAALFSFESLLEETSRCLGNKPFDSPRLASANLLNQVVRSSEDPVVMIDRDFVQMLSDMRG
jgi:hypothetical protein